MGAEKATPWRLKGVTLTGERIGAAIAGPPRLPACHGSVLGSLSQDPPFCPRVTWCGPAL